MPFDNAPLRPARLTDIAQMYGISCRAHLDPLYKTLIPAESYEKFHRFYTPGPEKQAKYYETIARRLQDESWLIWIYEDKGEVYGYAMAVDLEDRREIRGVFVEPQHQGRGIGHQLFRLCLDTHQPILLEVIQKNKRARAMYEKAGFKTVANPAKRFYGAELLTMGRY